MSYIYEYGHQYLTYLPQLLLSKLFFRKKVWLRNTLPTYGLDIYIQTFAVFFFKALLSQSPWNFFPSDNCDLPLLNF